MALVGNLSSQPQDFSTPRKSLNEKTPGSRNLTQTPGARSVTSTGLRALRVREPNENSAFKHIGTHHRTPTFASIMQRKVTPIEFERTERKQPMVTSKSEKKVSKLANGALAHANRSVKRTPRRHEANKQSIVQEPITSPMTPKKKKKAEFNVVAAHFLPEEAKELARLMAFSPPSCLPSRYAPADSPLRDKLMQDWLQAIPESIGDKKLMQEWLQAIPLSEPSKTKFSKWIQQIPTSKLINDKLIESWIRRL